MLVMLTVLGISLLLFFNQELGERVIRDYDGFSWKWAFAFIGLCFLAAFLKVNFDKYASLEDDHTSLKTENDDLKRIALDIEYSELPPHRDFVGGLDIFRIAVRNKSQTSDVRTVNLWLVNISSVGGWRHNLGEMRLRQYQDNPPAGNPFRQDATLTPGEVLNFEFISRWRDPPTSEIIVCYHNPGSIPRGQYRITLKATGSNCRPVFRQFLVEVDSRDRLKLEPFPSYSQN
jgi:hypothetical protein